MQFSHLAPDSEGSGRWSLSADERVKALLEALPLCVKLLDRQGRLLEMNGSGLRLIEASSLAEAQAHSLAGLVVERDRPAFTALIERVFAGESGRLEFEIVGLRGGRRWLETEAVPLRDAGGDVRALLAITADITERRQAEAALRESEARNRIIAELVSDYAYVMRAESDGSLRGEWVTDAFFKVFGLTLEQIRQRGGWITLVHPDDLPVALEHARRVARGQTDVAEMRWITASGEVRWLRDYARPVFDDSGRVVRVYGAAQDITEQRIAEAATREAREWLSGLIQSVDGIVWEAEPDTLRFTFVSQRAERLLGYPVRQWIEEPDFWVRHLHPEDRERAVTYCLECTRQLRDHEFEYRMIAADGRVVWLRDIVTVVSEGGRPVRLRGIIVDITARKLAEQRLLELNRTYAVLSAVNQLIVREEDDQALLEQACRVAVEVGGFAAACVMRSQGSRFEVVASSGTSEDTLRLIRLVHEDSALGCAFTSRAATTGERAVCNDIASDPLALPWREAALEQGYRSMAAFPLKVSADWVGTLNLYSRTLGYFEGPELALLEDLALDLAFALRARALERERVRAQERLRASEERLREVQKLEAIGRLAGGVAHDFNNVLAAIVMQAELAVETPGLPGSVKEDLQAIRSAAERAAGLTRQLLLFGRRQAMQPRPLDINETVTNLSRFLQRLLGEDVRLQLDLSPGSLVTYGDPAMLDQVLLNLAINARDAMPQGGRLRVETAAEVVDEAKARTIPDVAPGPYVRISVSDEGLGIAPDVLPRIFEPFFTTKEVGKGTGLGLSTVFGIVREHRGWIDVDSTPGKGSTFHVFLPAAGPVLQADQSQAAQPAPGGSETVLLVEDDSQVRNVARQVLERHGYRVLEAASGVDALRLYESSQPIHVVVTDMVMPGGVSGAQLARRMRALQPTLRFVFLSGYSTELGMAAGPDEGIFLQKPFSQAQLLEAVRKALDSASA